MTISNEQVGVRFIWTGTGTGSPITAGAAVPGYVKPPASFNGKTTGYIIRHPTNGQEFEKGIGTWNSAGAGSLTRTTILQNGLTSSQFPSATAAVFTAGDKVVEFVPVPDDFGALAGKTQANTADIVDDAVTLAKMAHNTANGLVGYDATGAPIRIAPGSNISISAGVISSTAGGGGGTTLPTDDVNPLVRDVEDNTKLVRIDAGQLSSGQTRAIVMADEDVDLTDTATGTFARKVHEHDLSTDPFSGNLSLDKLAEAAAWSVLVRNAGSLGARSDATDANLSEETTPATGDWLLGWAAGQLRKFNVGNIGGGKFVRAISAATAITADAALDRQSVLLRAATAVTITLSQTAGTNTHIDFIKETDQTITVQITGAAVYRLPGDDDSVQRTASFILTGAARFIGDGSVWMIVGATDHEVIWQSHINANGKQVYGNVAKQENATGSISGSASGRTLFLTGNITGVPVTAGWHAALRNKSGSSKTITPASGTCIKTEDGTTAASVTLGNNKACFVEGDGTNLFVDGDVT